MANLTVLKKLSMAATGAVVLALGTMSAASAAILGGRLFAIGENVRVEVLGSDAAFTSELRLYNPNSSNITVDVLSPSTVTNLNPYNPSNSADGLFIATNKETGKVLELGGFTAGEELIFGILVNNFFRQPNVTYTLKTGPGDLNPDGFPYAKVEFLNSGEAIVSFEDILRQFNSDLDYNDLAFKFTGVSATANIPQPVQSVPEHSSGLTMLAFAALGAASLLKRKQEQQQQATKLN